MDTIKVPDGKGGWTMVEAERVAGSQANLDRQKKILEDARVGEDAALSHAKALNAFENRIAAETDMSPDERVFALALYCIEMRAKFPAEFGGVTKFDEIAASAQKYYDSRG